MKLETINPVIDATPSTPGHSTPCDFMTMGGIWIWHKNDPNADGTTWFESREEALRVAEFIKNCLKLAKATSPHDFMEWLDYDLLSKLTKERRKKDIAKYNEKFNRVFGENKYEVCPSDQSFTDLEIMSFDTAIQKWESEFVLTSDEGKDGFTEYRFSYHCYDSTTGVTDWCEDRKVFENEIDVITHVIKRIVNEKISQHEQD